MHKQWGVAIFVLYLAQLAFGAGIHYYKPKAWAKGEGRRPFQNYFHAVTGLLIIALAMFQVRAAFTSLGSRFRQSCRALDRLVAKPSFYCCCAVDASHCPSDCTVCVWALDLLL